MLTGLRLGSMLLAPLLCFAAIGAQELPSGPSPTEKTITLDVVVSPKSGAPVAELRQQDFSVYDNKTPQPITSFRALGGDQPPTEVILLIDAVNISYDNLAYVRTETDKFLRANGGHLAHPTALAVFTDKGTQIEPGFSSDGNALSAGFDKFAIGLRDIRRSEGFWGADERLQLSLTALRQLTAREAGRPGRKLLLWVSPGWPILSGPHIELDAKQQNGIFATVADVSTQLRQARITLYSINPLGADEGVGRALYYEGYLKGVSKAEQTQAGNLALQVLAMQSGGLALNSSGVAESLQKCVADTDAFYELSFPAGAAEHPNTYHHIEVRLSRPGLTARTRDGYYAQP